MTIAMPTQFQNEIGNGSWASNFGESSELAGTDIVATIPAWSVAYAPEGSGIFPMISELSAVAPPRVKM